jgi:hypothetical protein
VAVAIYSNPELQKQEILSENRGKGGVYRWTNIKSGKSYIGSAVDLSKRLAHYFSEKYMEKALKRVNSAIYNAILKYGLSNFSLEILDYCERPCVIYWEQCSLDLWKPEYNILPIAGSRLGSKHSEETINLISTSLLGRKRPFGAGRPSQKIEVFDKNTNQTTSYDGIAEAARALNIYEASIRKYISRKQ